ncbi:hypothetical protein [Pseudomonas sp. NBRC 100443]|nr:hypothetical protein [Pseudomonas sp. NBRC 100443]GLU39861.1 hypothetical protein Pssp01_39540 [Pseudomonas sp. NBRC 100443]
MYGPLELFGRQHELTLGANYGRSHLKAGADTIAANGYYTPWWT